MEATAKTEKSGSSCNSSRVNKDGSKTIPGLFSKFLEESKYEG